MERIRHHIRQMYLKKALFTIVCINITAADSTDGRRRRYHLGRPDPAAGIDLYLCTVHNSLHVLPTEAKGTSDSACKRRLPHYRE